MVPERVLNALTPHRIGLGVALCGVFLFAWRAGFHIIDPTNLGWLSSQDLGQHFIAWTMFRGAPWQFPLGAVPNVIPPIGSTVGFMDAIPWLAVFFKAFNFILPERFQYVGLWLASCFAFLGYFGTRLISVVTDKRGLQALGGLIFASSWVLVWRLGHEALSAQWVLVALIWLHVRPAGDARKTALTALGLTMFTAGVHPYLMGITFVLSLSLLLQMWRVDRTIDARRFALGTLGLLCGVFAVLGMFGYLTASVGRLATGFGYYSAELSTLINPVGSRMFEGWDRGPGQYEGYGFVGTGVLALALITVARALVGMPDSEVPETRRFLQRNRILAVTCVFCAFYAFSPSFLWRNVSTIDLTGFYAPFKNITGNFRANGRFIWPLFYASTFLILAGFLRRFRNQPSLQFVLLSAALLVQLVDYDTSPLEDYFRQRSWPAFTDPRWKLAHSYRQLSLYPPQIVFEDSPCPGPALDHYIRYSYLAYQLGVTINSGRPGRVDPIAAGELCSRMAADVAAHRFEPDQIYLVADGAEAPFKESPDMVCDRLDDQWVCVRDAPANAFAAALKAAP